MSRSRSTRTRSWRSRTDWLDTKGVDLEEKLGGEIVPPESDDDDKGSGDKEPDFDDMDFDDIFGKDDKDGKKDDE